MRQNAFTGIGNFEPITQTPVKLTMANELLERIGRKPLDLLYTRVALASGALPYLKTAQRRTFFEEQLTAFNKIGHSFRSHAEHGRRYRGKKQGPSQR